MNIVLNASIRCSGCGYVKHNSDVNKITMRQYKGTTSNSSSISHVRSDLKTFGYMPMFSNLWRPPMRAVTFREYAWLLVQLGVNLKIGVILNCFNPLHCQSYLIKNPTLYVNVAGIVCCGFDKWVCPFQAAMNQLKDKPYGVVCRMPNIILTARCECNILDRASGRFRSTSSYLLERVIKYREFYIPIPCP